MVAIGLLGGTFDPVHLGHLQLAEAALNEKGMAQIIFIPAAYPPHKSLRHTCSFEHRLNMLKIAVSKREDFSISDIETKQSQPSYTIETLRNITTNKYPDRQYHFIIGFDAFLDIESWHCWQDIISSTNFILAVRPGYNHESIAAFLFRNHFSPQDVEQQKWKKRKEGNEINLLTTVIDDISSTDIRRRIAAKNQWHHLLPDGVPDYIQNNYLYT